MSGKTQKIIKMSTYPLIVVVVILVCLCHMSVAMEEKKTYIIHMAKSQMPATFDDHTHWYDASLKSVSESAEMIYVYNNVIHGFAARLTAQEAESLETQPGILSVLPEVIYQLHTTRTPLFLGLDNRPDIFNESDATSNVIIGVLDSGVWPERRSFDDTELGPVPDSWKGQCESGTNFSSAMCNRKLIGARYFSSGYEATLGPIDESKESKSPRDDDGHGTHTASTAAGSLVQGASLLGYASGTARGMAYRARVAVYKVCWLGGCFSPDVLAGMDKAIADNVDVLSLSLGGRHFNFYSDDIAIGAFAAMEKGILVSCSAGNAGPNQFSLANQAPWITTVGAGTIDRDFPAYVSLGNGKNFSGVSLYAGDPLPSGMLPLVYAGNASNATNGNLCIMGTLIPEKVKGKIVLCDRGVNARAEKGYVVKSAGGAGMILANTAANGEELVADAHFLPAATVGQIAGDAIKKYLTSDPNPTATILFGGTKVGIQPSPVLGAFSSRGPNSITPEILKPDIIAPGINILAGWTGAVGPTGLPEDDRRVEFNIISGTSMSCPHVSGIAALLKGVHPEWSPAAIRSALMTTAYTTYMNGGALLDVATGKPSTPFGHGAGHVDPISAVNPGLVYDINANDYLNYLCALKYTPSQINSIARRNFTCDSSKKYSVTDLNYPSFAVPFPADTGSNTIKYSRTLTNVGPSGTYNVTVSLPDSSVEIIVEPEAVSFTQINEKKSYTVSFTAPSKSPSTNVFGRIEWSDGKHVISSPVAISWT
ncbi:subtilisin-like protease SBT1.7 [Solanum stenotomum]|uniref:subtilisin-like protease SBT1.7 n=1 Tax=Solanum stenotomum TaxID=172797 RepID=UPI0020D1F17F|nr:subtilisin-like protease SBT1.7 [Solanum stenotomum]